jgi:tetratricopeptide (TPR) repeat protein
MGTGDGMLSWLRRREDVPSEVDPAAVIAAAESLQANGQTGSALECYDRAVSSDDSQAELWARRGALLLELQRAEEAAESYGRAAALAPGVALHCQQRGLALLAAGVPAQAVEALVRAVALDDRLAAAHRGLGTALRQTHQLPEAATALERAAALAPDDPDTWYDYAFTLVAADRPREALAAFARYGAVAAPEHPRREAAERVVALLQRRLGAGGAES